MYFEQWIMCFGTPLCVVLHTHIISHITICAVSHVMYTWCAVLLFGNMNTILCTFGWQIFMQKNAPVYRSATTISLVWDNNVFLYDPPSHPPYYKTIRKGTLCLQFFKVVGIFSIIVEISLQLDNGHIHYHLHYILYNCQQRCMQYRGYFQWSPNGCQLVAKWSPSGHQVVT